MKAAELALRQYFDEPQSPDLVRFDGSTLAEIFVGSAHFATVSADLMERRWLSRVSTQASSTVLGDLDRAFKAELASLAFLETMLRDSKESELRAFARKAEAVRGATINEILARPSDQFRDFVRTAIHEMATRVDSQQRSGSAPDSLYRCFDAMDEVFGLDYRRDHGMIAELNQTHRLYEGAGIGVQTSYATFFEILSKLQLPTHARLIDLGSGYGRMGLVAGLWRDDLEFTGYEYVAHRVEIARAAAARAGLAQRVRFYAQDLGAADFSIPEADLYYMFDPFNGETYSRVIGRLIEIGRARVILVVAKGGACDRFEKAALAAGWSESEKHDAGTLAIFRSKGR